MTLIREKPPLRLTVDVEAPSGLHYRWAEDAHRSENAFSTLSFSTTMPGGFENFSCQLGRRTDMDYPDLAEFSKVNVRGLGGGHFAYQGRLEQTPRNSQGDTSVNPQSVGYQAMLDDDASVVVIFVDRDCSKWAGPSLPRQLNMLRWGYNPGSGSAVPDPVNGMPALLADITGAWASGQRPQVESWYDAGAKLIAGFWYDITWAGKIAGTDPGWSANTALSSDDVFTQSDDPGNHWNANLAEQKGYFFPSNGPRRFAAFSVRNDANMGVEGNDYPTYWHEPAVYGPAAWYLTRYGTQASPGGTPQDPGGFLASDMVAFTLNTYVPGMSYTLGPNGTIRPSNFVVPQAAYLTPGTSSAIIKDLNKYELEDWAVWEGPTFFWAPRGTFSKEWIARVHPASLQDAGPQVSTIWNGVVVPFTDTAGVNQSVGPPGSGATIESTYLIDNDPQNPANEEGIRRWTVLPSIGTSTSGAAIQIGQIFLKESKLLNTAGQASLVGHVLDSAGNYWPSWMVRAGDTIRFVDAADTSPRRIVRTDYDHSSRTCSVSLDSPPQGLQQLLDRLGAVTSAVLGAAA